MSKSKKDVAIEIVREIGHANKEECLAKIMEANDTYRSNATIYFNKAVKALATRDKILNSNPAPVEVAAPKPAKIVEKSKGLEVEVELEEEEIEVTEEDLLEIPEFLRRNVAAAAAGVDFTKGV
ncbi:MAG: hypothetical protein EBY41_00330 [Proteobacteria bacterium]|nr:hypothetical protein [Pseudomonadota bacterium]